MTTYLQTVGHYVYAHQRPDTGEVFYVGKGTGKRLTTRSKRNNYWSNIVNKCGGFTPILLANGLTEQEAYSFERTVIQAIQKQTTLKLCNMIGGGRGGSFNPSPEVRAKQRAAKVGRKLTDKHKMKISLSQVGKVHRSGFKLNLTDEQRVARAEMARNQVWTKERGERISAAKLGFKHSEETKKKISASKQNCTEETKMKISASKKGKKWTEKQREAIMAGRVKAK